MALKQWIVAACDRRAVRAVAQQTGIPPMAAALLQARGFKTAAQVKSILEGEPLRDPMAIHDMAQAAARVQKAIDNFEKIAVYGDYDADGVTATAMLYSYLESCGADVLFYIPEREGEGYGLNMHAVDTLHDRQVDLIVTVDNGISSLEEVAHAAELGMDVVVTDHHRPRPELPKAVAVVDPFCPGDQSCCQGLCGAGVAFKLIQALEGPESDVQGLLENYADLLTIATVGDSVPLTGENRTFVQFGLRMLPYSERAGLQALLNRAGLAGKTLRAQSVAFGIVPRINATGRMGAPDRAVRLLLTEDPIEADSLAADICEDNDYRRQVEDEICTQAMAQLQQEPARLWDRVLVVAGQDWHHGVIGIVASRLVERFGKPCIVLSVTGRETRGSGRSVEGFSLFQAVAACAPLLTKYGGHPMAAGLTLPTAAVEDFRRQINAYAAAQGPMPMPSLHLDAALKPNRLSLDIPRAAALLEPFGTGNPQPLYGLFGVTLKEIQPIGGGRHLRLICTRDGVRLRCTKFGMDPQSFPYHPGDVLDLAVELEVDDYNGRESLSILVRDMKLSGCDAQALAAGQALFDKARRGDPLTPEEGATLLPDRAACAGLYRTLRAMGGYRGGAEGLAGRTDMPFARVLVCLELFAEHGLIDLEAIGDAYAVTLRQPQGKVDLFDSAFFRSLQSHIQALPKLEERGEAG